jgi:hypothetical protein
MDLCNVCKVGPAVKGHSCRRQMGCLEIKCETCHEWFFFSDYFSHPCKAKKMRPDEDKEQVDVKSTPLCKTCQRPLLHTQATHDAVYHGPVEFIGGRGYPNPVYNETGSTECDFCGITTFSFPSHYMNTHEGEKPLRLGATQRHKFIKCPFAGTCASVTTIAIEYHLKTKHQIEDCKCGVAMTHPQFHKCGYDVKSYCYVCMTWVQGCDRLRYAMHIETHMPKKKGGYKECPVCRAWFLSYEDRVFASHSCGEMRRGKKGRKLMMCGRCMESVDNLKELHEHYMKDHLTLSSNKGAMTQAEIDFEKARDDMTKFPCVMCRQVFQTGWDYSEHVCNGEVAKKNHNAVKIVSDVASILAKVGKPDPEGGVSVIQCSICGNRFHAEAVYNSHACKTKGHDKKRIALLISPDREDKSHVDAALKEYGGEVIVYTRGIPSEDYAEAEFRKAGATIIKISNDNPSRRDATMIQQADLCLMFPSKKTQKSFAVVKTKITAMGAKVDAVMYPDNQYIEPLPVPAVEHKQQPGGVCSCGRTPCLEVPKSAEAAKSN